MKYYLGLDVGGTNLAAGVVTEDYKIISRATTPSGAGRSVDEIVQSMAEVSREAIAKAGLKESDFDYWGIGMPSYVNPKTNLLVHANCFGWRNVPILDYMRKHMNLPPVTENDANCAAFGEILAGAGKNFSKAIVLTLGTGFGSGIILDRKIYTGADNMGGELGHTKLVYNGKQCTCGQYGCMESYCSARALAEMAREAIAAEPERNTLMMEMCGGNPEELTVYQIFESWKQADAMATELVEQYVSYLCAGMSTFITIFRPEIIILGGGVANAGDEFLKLVNDRLEVNTFAGAEIGVPKVIRAELGNDAGIIGAAMLGRQINSK